MTDAPRRWNRARYDRRRAKMLRDALRLLRFIAVQKGYGTTVLSGSVRRRELVMIRAAFVWVARHGIAMDQFSDPEKRVPVSFPTLGKVLGDRDHSTIVHLFHRADDFRERDPEYTALTDRWLEMQRKGLIPVEAELPVVTKPRRKIEPFKLTACRKPKNDLANDDDDAMKRLRASDLMIAALRREHPERCCQALPFDSVTQNLPHPASDRVDGSPPKEIEAV